MMDNYSLLLASAGVICFIAAFIGYTVGHNDAHRKAEIDKQRQAQMDVWNDFMKKMGGMK